MLVEPQWRTPVLTDGLTVSDLIGNDDDRWVAGRIMSDPEVFRLELETIFDKVWVFLAHESEIPAPGDFVTRYIGRDPVIVTRGEHGDIDVVLNICSHRGGRVCAAERGSTDIFRCSYHGWVYETSGALLGITAERETYCPAPDKTTLGLKRARVARYRGLVFATWNESGPDLEEYLGDTRFYLDLLFGNTDHGMEVAGPPQRWVVPANWKLAAENFSTDSYHTVTTHKSLMDLGLFPTVSAESRGAFVNVTDVAAAHSTALRKLPDLGLSREEGLAMLCQMIGVPPELSSQLERNLSAEQLSLALGFAPIAGNVFPNLGWLRIPFVTEFGGPRVPAMSIRLWHPMAPDATEIWSWALVEREASDEMKVQARRAVIRMFGPSGIAEQDDTAMWSAIQAGTQGVQGRQRRFMYQSHRDPDATWPGPGRAVSGAPTEDNQWNFFLRWRELMRS